ncbi:MAG: hypothetical protein G8237_13450 [Magnetococcales bacterium]|nr:hypothetical protein [Magnetococcales bacterium]
MSVLNTILDVIKIDRLIIIENYQTFTCQSQTKFVKKGNSPWGDKIKKWLPQYPIVPCDLSVEHQDGIEIENMNKNDTLFSMTTRPAVQWRAVGLDDPLDHMQD